MSYLSARLTHEEAAEAVSRVLPMAISARQVGQVLQPIGEAFLRREDQHVQNLLEQGTEKRLGAAERQEEQGERIRRLYVELDGVMARLRRGSVPMEKAEREREGDVYREVKVGAVFVGSPGPERSELVPGVFVDTPGPIQYVARRTTAEDFAPRLYALARQNGLLRAQQVVVLADGAKWIWKLAESNFLEPFRSWMSIMFVNMSGTSLVLLLLESLTCVTPGLGRASTTSQRARWKR